jgi:hypothetical protein
MTTTPRIAAIDPDRRGFAFALLDSRYDLIDWGKKRVAPGDTTAHRGHVQGIIDAFAPDVLVLEDPTGAGSRRCKRVCTVLAELSDIAYAAGVTVAWITRAQIRQAFGCHDKQDIAELIAAHFPELAPRLPRQKRMAGDPEPEGLNLFDAVSFALTYYHQNQAPIIITTPPLCPEEEAT